MNRKTIIAIIVIILLALLAWFLLRDKSGDSDSTTNNSSTSSNGSNGSNGSDTRGSTELTSLKDLLALNKNQKCTFSVTDNGTTSNGTFYVSGGKYRGDFTSTVDGKTQTSHMMMQDGTNYVWMDGTNAGFKMKLDDTASANTGAAQSIDPNKDLNYNCENWSVDSSMFKLPSTVQFQDIGAMMPSSSTSGSAGASGGVNYQAACAQLSEPAKTQCLNGIQ